jgi:hypothetical protein
VATEPAKHLRLGVMVERGTKRNKKKNEKEKPWCGRGGEVHQFISGLGRNVVAILCTSALEGNEDEHAGSGEAEGRIAIHHSMESRQRAQDSTQKENETPNRRG